MIRAECNIAADGQFAAGGDAVIMSPPSIDRPAGIVAKTAAISPEIIGQAIDNAPPTKPLIFIIGIAAAGYFFDSFDISIISYALPSVAKEFHLVPQQLGLVGSAACCR